MTWQRAVVFAGVLLLMSCDDMAVQPKQKDYSPQPGPVAAPADVIFFTERPSAAPPLNLALLRRGQVEYRAYCTPCHAETGDGNGMVVQRGFPRPPSLLSSPLRQASTKSIVDAISNGSGVMYSFAARVAPHDRWAIAAYIRALQLADAAPLGDVPAAERGSLP